MNKVSSRNSLNVRVMTKIGMLGAVAFILMYFQFPLAFIAPSFMQVDISDLPILIGSFALGPVPAILISALKNVLHLAIKGTSTGGVGELSNFIISSVFAVTAGMVYKKKRTFKGAILGLFLGTIVMTITAIISNYFFIFPLYAKLMPMEAIINAGSKITSRITDLWSLMIYSVLPFNLLKGFITSAVTILIYKRVSIMFKN